MSTQPTAQIVDPRPGEGSRHGGLWFVFRLLAGLFAGLGSYAGVGHSLWLFFAPMLLAAVFIPYFTLAEEPGMRRPGACLLIAVGITLAWRFVTHLSLLDLLRCGAVAAAFALALGGIAVALARTGIGATFAAGVTALLAFAWLSWPIWLCPWLDGRHAQGIVNALVVAHPLLALNRVVFDLYHEWDRYPLMYQITILNQDVLYDIPASIGWSCAGHTTLGLVGFFAVGFRTNANRRTAEQQDVE